MGSARLDSLSDYARRKVALHAQCRRCGRAAQIDPQALFMTCLRRGWNEQLAAITWQLRCTGCGARDAQFRHMRR